MVSGAARDIRVACEEIVDVPGEEIRDLYKADLALIRPDQSVAWRGNGIEDPVGLIDTVRGV